MSSYNNIKDPITGNTFSIFSTQGKTLLKQYVKLLQSGGMNTPAIASVPANAPDITRQPSLQTYDKQKKKEEKAKLQKHGENEAINQVLNPSKTVNNQPKSKIVVKNPICDGLKKRLDSAKNEIVNLQKDYNDKGCSEEYNQTVDAALANINPFQ